MYTFFQTKSISGWSNCDLFYIRYRDPIGELLLIGGSGTHPQRRNVNDIVPVTGNRRNG